ncbi:PREDICTED: transforming growth factor beta-1-induced transcript 1 protein-like [Nicrophorus vespilloides]|uniref:Transforming growth factor beta-1-induced transcript 1 protein-like n=1 Tax=Nicrophorus vespilloides TaxID=110193 RepID=A0ABM1MSV4_NICVS|nr:PREDICTED: transforming growth factor beta-1-induced transcript 1 protein-like [Nicrophorus vespilloides]
MTSECDTCKLPIVGKSINALGKTYHPDHFVCGKCNKPITESPFHQRDGKPLCDADFTESCPKCAACNKPITDKIVTAMDKQWHENHFVCALCNGALLGQEFHQKEGKPICQICYRGKVADKCNGCGEPIETCATIALNAKWHPDCFKCKTCGKAISTTKFKVDSKGFPMCESC